MAELADAGARRAAVRLAAVPQAQPARRTVSPHTARKPDSQRTNFEKCAEKTLPNGYCGLPLQQSCPHPNACLSCDYFLTTEEFLPVHRDQLAETERLIAHAEAEGSERKREMNETVRVNLVRIIEGLESIAEQSPDDAVSGEVGDGS